MPRVIQPSKPHQLPPPPRPPTPLNPPPLKTNIKPRQINFTMGALLQARGEDLYRMKGILAIKGLPERYVFQVGFLFEEGGWGWPGLVDS
jgi:hypothetical protein